MFVIVVDLSHFFPDSVYPGAMTFYPKSTAADPSRSFKSFNCCSSDQVGKPSALRSRSSHYAGVYFAVIASFSLLGNWAQSGTNFPILSDIVPPKNRSPLAHIRWAEWLVSFFWVYPPASSSQLVLDVCLFIRTKTAVKTAEGSLDNDAKHSQFVSQGKVMAVECALENSIATLIGPLFVANLANAFGYQFGRVKDRAWYHKNPGSTAEVLLWSWKVLHRLLQSFSNLIP